ncbi:MAG TPA: GntR family transcriptional regulator [Solirubrobacteraceae bacterium]|jgi:GntR family transcriptional repressor for pyruvate dehydrogenase complex
MAAPIPRTSVPDLVFDRLREAILSGSYTPGERLPPQRALAADLEVNLSSVREALGRLEQLRLLEVRHGDGARVLDWRRSGGLEALVLQAGMPGPLARDLFEARRLLLVEAARLAAERRSPEQADALAELARAVATAPGDAEALMADWEFMSMLVESAGNLVFQLIMNSVRELYLPRAEDFAAIVGRREQLAALYPPIADAVAAGEQPAAAAATDRLARAQAERWPA